MEKYQKHLSRIERFFDVYLRRKAPSLPFDWKKDLKKYSALMGLALALFSLLVYYGSWERGIQSSLGFIIMIVQCAVFLTAIPALIRHQKSGWHQLFYGVMLGAVFYLFTLQLLNIVVVSIVSLYVLFQVKRYYH